MTDLEINILPIAQTGFGLADLASFMRSVDDEFNPPLRSMVNIDEYCAKLLSRAEVLVAYAGESIAGVCAIYCNDRVNKTSYVPYGAVSPEYRRRGIAEALYRSAIHQARRSGMQVVTVRTWIGNATIIRVFKKVGFLEQRVMADRADGGMSVHFGMILARHRGND